MIIEDITTKKGVIKNLKLNSLEVGEQIEFICDKYSKPLELNLQRQGIPFPIYKWIVSWNNVDLCIIITQSMNNIIKSCGFPIGSVVVIKKDEIAKMKRKQKDGSTKEIEFGKYSLHCNGKIWRNYKIKAKQPNPIRLNIKKSAKPSKYEESLIRQMNTYKIENGSIERQFFVGALTEQANIPIERAEELFDHWF